MFLAVGHDLQPRAIDTALREIAFHYPRAALAQGQIVLVRAAIDKIEIEKSVLLRMSPIAVKIRLQDDPDLVMATFRLKYFFIPPFGALNCRQHNNSGIL